MINRTRVKTLSRLGAGIALAALALHGLARPACADDEKLLAEVRARFEPEKPPIRMTYNIAYRFLFLHINHLADATVHTTEGRWRGTDKQWTPAFFIEATIDTLDDRAQPKRGRVSIHRRFISVLRPPDLETLLSVKQADEYVSPLFKEVKQTHYVEVFDMESGALAYRRHDYLTGVVTTNPTGEASTAQQGQELAVTLKLAAPVYRGRRPMLKYASSPRVTVNIDGIGTPFACASRMDETPIAVLGAPMRALRIDMRPAPEAHGRGRPVALWIASFQDVVRHLARETPSAADGNLAEAARAAAEWSMIPLVADYGMAIGRVRVNLTGIGLGAE